MKTYQLYLNGAFVDNADRCMMEVLNPSTGELYCLAPQATADDADRAVRAAALAQPAWAKTPASERARCLKELSRLVSEHEAELTAVLMAEQGKVRDLALGEVRLGAQALDYIAGQAMRVDGDIIASDHPAEQILLFKKPIGVAVGILPWNYPFYLIIRKMAPALITGNAIVIKPAPETPAIAYEFARLVQQSGLPGELFSVLSGGASVGEALASHPQVGIVSLTGSVAAGAAVMRAASRHITKVSLELGGKAPVIVMDDADLDAAVEDIYQSRICNSGQVCSCAERVYVHSAVAGAFIDKMVRRMAATRYGNPNETDALDMGPIISLRQLQSIENAVNRAVEQGGKVLLGGKRAAISGGFYFEPTVISGTHDMDIFHNEIFGPVLPITTFDNFDEAVAMANDCAYGLTSSVFTKNVDIMMRATQELQFGETYVNRAHGESMQGFHSGWKLSGIGGADGKYGLEEYVQHRVVYVRYDDKRK